LVVRGGTEGIPVHPRPVMKAMKRWTFDPSSSESGTGSQVDLDLFAVMEATSRDGRFWRELPLHCELPYPPGRHRV